MGERDPELDKRIAAMSTALAKLPPFTGLIYRGTDLPDEVLAQYRPADEFVELGFTSASTKPPRAGNTQFTIQSRTGKDISQFSQRPDEHEVTIDHGARFRVLSHDIDDETSVHYINLKELG
jgi:hypothetical protein